MNTNFFTGLIPDEREQGADAKAMSVRKADPVLDENRRVKTSLYITPALLRRLKVYCASNSLTMADVLDECISAYLQRKERLADKHNSSNTD